MPRGLEAKAGRKSVECERPVSPVSLYRFLIRWAVKFFSNLFRDEQGGHRHEYGLIAALIAVAAMTAMGALGDELTTTFTTVVHLQQR